MVFIINSINIIIAYQYAIHTKDDEIKKQHNVIQYSKTIKNRTKESGKSLLKYQAFIIMIKAIFSSLFSSSSE